MLVTKELGAKLREAALNSIVTDNDKKYFVIAKADDCGILFITANEKHEFISYILLPDTLGYDTPTSSLAIYWTHENEYRNTGEPPKFFKCSYRSPWASDHPDCFRRPIQWRWHIPEGFVIGDPSMLAILIGVSMHNKCEDWISWNPELVTD